ncbi:hypothetical protein ABW636_08175 [Aquimarina sp. 2201CG1-2-11]|uniref:hypothetical protein n=1 Tax=Aquimarina discodermiae TaxID=3231043 RepID=UPI0034631B38
MENENKPTRKNWDLMIGIALILFGSLRLYNRLQAQAEWNFRTILTLSFILYGGFLVYRHIQTTKKN